MEEKLTDTDVQYAVVINREQQYSIWPTFKKIPQGWAPANFEGSKKDCLDHIEKVWTDMRPLSLRKDMEMRKAEFEMIVQEAQKKPAEGPYESSTVNFLAKDKHPVRVHEVEASKDQFKEVLKNQMIHIVFEDTKGETCLRVDLNSESNHTPKNGIYSLVGDLELDFTLLRCFMEIDARSLRGYATLKRTKELK